MELRRADDTSPFVAIARFCLRRQNFGSKYSALRSAPRIGKMPVAAALGPETGPVHEVRDGFHAFAPQ